MFSMRSVVVAVSLSFQMSLAGCLGVVIGSGDEIEDSRDVRDFSRIAVHQGLEVYATVGLERSVTVRGDDNLVRRVTTVVRGGKLDIDVEDWMTLAPVAGLVIDVTVPSLEALSASGGSRLTVDGIDADELRVEASGGSRVMVEGVVGELSAHASGGSGLRLHNLPAEFADVEASGGSEIDVRVTEEVRIEGSGGARIRISGRPVVARQSLSGGSSVDIR